MIVLYLKKFSYKNAKIIMPLQILIKPIWSNFFHYPNALRIFLNIYEIMYCITSDARHKVVHPKYYKYWKRADNRHCTVGDTVMKNAGQRSLPGLGSKNFSNIAFLPKKKSTLWDLLVGEINKSLFWVFFKNYFLIFFL